MQTLKKSPVSKLSRETRGTRRPQGSRQTTRHYGSVWMSFLETPESLRNLTPDTMHSELTSLLSSKGLKTTATTTTLSTPILCSVSQLPDDSVLVTPTSKICPEDLHLLSGGQWSLVLTEGKSSKLTTDNSSSELQDS